MNVPSLLISALLVLIGLVIFLILQRKKDAIETAFTGLATALIIMAGGLSVQNIEFSANIPKAEVLGIAFTVTSFTVTGTPMPVWITAFLSIAALLAWLAKVIADERK